MNEAEVDKRIESLLARGAQLLEVVRRHGASVHDQHLIEHQFVAPSQRQAAQLAKELYDAGYLVLLLAPAPRGGDDWKVTAGIRRTPAAAADRQVAEGLVRLAGRHQADYEGWGMAV